MMEWLKALIRLWLACLDAIARYLAETNSMLQGPGSTLQEWKPGTFHLVFAKLLLAIIPNHTRFRRSNPSRLLYVVNHCLSGLDLPLLFAAIYISTGHWPRGLADRVHFRIPIWSHFLRFLGAVEGSTEIFEKLARAGNPILVFPGGARETMRKRSDKPYTLFWGKRKGFAREAMKHKYDIVPVGSIGVDENFTIVYDLPVGWILRIMGDNRTEITWPIIVPSFQFQRIYAFAGEPIDTKQYHHDWTNAELQEKVRDETKRAVEEMISLCLAFQAADEFRFVQPPWKSRI